MPQKTFDILVNKLWRYKGKMVEIETIKKLIAWVIDADPSSQKVYKVIHMLKNKDYLISLKKTLLYSKDPDTNYPDTTLLDMFYRPALKKHTKDYITDGNRYIGGLKAVELTMQNYDIPEEILVVTADKQATEVVMLDKTICCKTYQFRGQNLYKKLSSFTQAVKVGKSSFVVAKLELAILEALFNPTVLTQGYTTELIKKIIRKTNLNISIITSIIKLGKHHSSLNRLHTIAISVKPALAHDLYDIIKKYSYIINTK